MSLIAQTPGGSAQFLAGAFAADGILAGPFSANQNDFAPDQIQGATLIHIRASVAISITGMLAAGANVLRWLHNDSDVTVTLTNEDAASGSANRFALGANFAIA